jgi:hypothetical protein
MGGFDQCVLGLSRRRSAGFVSVVSWEELMNRDYGQGE